MGPELVTGACGHVLSCGIGSHSEKEGACLSVRSMCSLPLDTHGKSQTQGSPRMNSSALGSSTRLGGLLSAMCLLCLSFLSEGTHSL